MANLATAHVEVFDIPALVVGLLVGLYWWRVVRMAVKMRRKTGRAANWVPVEPLGRALRWIWQPVVWTWIAGPLLMAFIARPPLLLRPLYRQAAVEWAAVIVAIAAYAATRVCWKRMGSSWRMGIDPNEKTSLIFTGPYAYVRHPIYALSSVLMLATVLAAPAPLMIAAALLHLLLLQWEAAREERHLCRLHGQPYIDYQSKVGRFIPRFRSNHSAGPVVS